MIICCIAGLGTLILFVKKKPGLAILFFMVCTMVYAKVGGGA